MCVYSSNASFLFLLFYELPSLSPLLIGDTYHLPDYRQNSYRSLFLPDHDPPQTDGLLKGWNSSHWNRTNSPCGINPVLSSPRPPIQSCDNVRTRRSFRLRRCKHPGERRCRQESFNPYIEFPEEERVWEGSSSRSSLPFRTPSAKSPVEAFVTLYLGRSRETHTYGRQVDANRNL